MTKKNFFFIQFLFLYRHRYLNFVILLMIKLPTLCTYFCNYFPNKINRSGKKKKKMNKKKKENKDVSVSHAHIFITHTHMYMYTYMNTYICIREEGTREKPIS